MIQPLYKSGRKGPKVGIEAHTVGSAALVGEPLPTFGENRRCETCPAVLSVYNPKDTCRPCQVKARVARMQQALAGEQERLAEEQRLREARAEAVPYKRVSRQDVKDYLCEHPGARANQIAPTFGATVQTMGQLLRNMWRDGELRREEGANGTRVDAGYRYFIKDGDS